MFYLSSKHNPVLQHHSFWMATERLENHGSESARPTPGDEASPPVPDASPKYHSSYKGLTEHETKGLSDICRKLIITN